MAAADSKLASPETPHHSNRHAGHFHHHPEVVQAHLPHPNRQTPLHADTLFLFDVDGTLTAPRLSIEQNMADFLRFLQTQGLIAVVGGSDLRKIKEQLGEEVIGLFDFVFSENGLVGHKNGDVFHRKLLKEHYTEDQIKRFMRFVLHYIADVDVPVKRGYFLEMRTGMFNVSPIGRDCSQQERMAFEAYDKIHQVRPKMVEAMRKEFQDLKMQYSIGGQISIDVFPQGWDKTYCLQFLSHFKRIHFFGDKTYQGGNDFEIFSSFTTASHTVKGPNHTISTIKNLLGKVQPTEALVTETEKNLQQLTFSPKVNKTILGYLNYFYDHEN